MVAAVSSSTPSSRTINRKTTPTRARSPLLPSDPDINYNYNYYNNNNALLAPLRRPKSRQVTSLYPSSSSSTTSGSTSTTPSSSSSTPKRCVSPLISRPGMMTPARTPSSTVNRSQSAESRRPVTPSSRRNNSLDSRIGNCGRGQVSNAQKMLITSTRSLSVSFQGESLPFQLSKAKRKPSPSPISSRKGTPERRTMTTTPKANRGGGADHEENSRPAVVVEQQHRWPGRLRQAPPPPPSQQPPSLMSRSLDFTDGGRRVIGALQNLLVPSVGSRLSSDSTGIELEKPVVSGTGLDSSGCDLPVNSDTESVSSGARTSEGSGNNAAGGGQRVVRGIVVPATVWQETNGRLQRQPGSPGTRAGVVGLKGPVPSKLMVPKKFGSESPVSSPRGVVNVRGQLSPIRGAAAARPASPSKLGTAASPAALAPAMRGMSPSRVRNGVVSSGLSNSSNFMPSILSFAVDIRRGKIGEKKIVEVHLLRILYNRFLQWRFVNARADNTLSVQRLDAEKSLYNAHVTTSKLRESVRAKRIELQQLRQYLKLISFLRGQMVYLDELTLIEQDYFHSLSGAIEALQASTLRLPVVAGARADVQNVKDAICSAVDVMQAMGSSICLLLPKVVEANSLVAELANLSLKDRALLDQCKDLLSTIASMQVKEYSLRTHILQLKRVPMELMMTTA